MPVRPMHARVFSVGCPARPSVTSRITALTPPPSTHPARRARTCTGPKKNLSAPANCQRNEVTEPIQHIHIRLCKCSDSHRTHTVQNPSAQKLIPPVATPPACPDAGSLRPAVRCVRWAQPTPFSRGHRPHPPKFVIDTNRDHDMRASRMNARAFSQDLPAHPSSQAVLTGPANDGLPMPPASR